MAERSEALPPEAIDALQRGNKIEAIKLVRAAQKLDLKDAKDRVDAYNELPRSKLRGIEDSDQEGSQQAAGN